MIMIECPHCGKLCKPLGIAAHIRIKHTEHGADFILLGNKSRKGKPSWNKGLTAETDERVKENSLNVGKSMLGISRPVSEETKMKISKTMKLVGGGYRQGSGRGKKGWYKGFFCDSSWELAFVIYNLEHGIDFTRCLEFREYEYEGKIRKYYPDFIVNGQLVEIKGYKSPQWEAKIASNLDVKVLYETDLQEILCYVKSKYGNDFIKMYE